jgi:hypothetical protein
VGKHAKERKREREKKKKLAKPSFLKFRLHIYILENNRIIGVKPFGNPHGCWVL